MKPGARSLFSGRPALIALPFLVCGILLAVSLDLPYSIPLILSIALFFALAATYLKGRFAASAWLLAVTLVFLGWYLTELATGDLPPNHISRFAAESGQVVLLGVVEEEPDIRSDKVYLVIEVDSVYKDDIWFPTLGRVRVSVKGTGYDFSHGDRLSLRGFLYSPNGPDNPGEFDYSAYLWSKGIFAAMSVSSAARAEVIQRGETFLSRVVSPLRIKLLSQTKQYLSPVSAAVLSGFILGERRDIPEKYQDLFRDTGTLHLMAVSGSNVALILAIFALPLSLLRIRRSIRVMVLLLITVFFAILTRLEPSVMRASIMAAVGLVAYGWIRKPDYINLLAFAGLLMLLWQPLQIFDIGAQLSFAATFGIVYALPRLMQILPRPSSATRRGLVWILALLLSTIAAQAAVLPLMAHHFGNLPALGTMANLPVGIMASASSSIGIAFYFSTLAGGWLSQLVSVPLEMLLNLTLSALAFFASLPYANIKVASPGILLIAIYWALLYLVFEITGIKRLSRLSLIFILILGNFWLWDGLLRSRPDWSLEFFDLGRSRAWIFAAKNQPTIACLDCNDPEGGADDIIVPHILGHHGGRLDLLISNTPDSSEVKRLAARFSAPLFDLEKLASEASAISPTSLTSIDYQAASNFPAALKVIWDSSDNEGGGKDGLPMLQIDVGDGQIILAGRTGAGTLSNLQVHSRVIVLELPWSAYARSSCLETIRDLNPEAVIFSPDRHTAFMPRHETN